jgi:hypothetical protein
MLLRLFPQLVRMTLLSLALMIPLSACGTITRTRFAALPTEVRGRCLVPDATHDIALDYVQAVKRILECDGRAVGAMRWSDNLQGQKKP